MKNIINEIKNRLHNMKYTWDHKLAIYRIWKKEDTGVSLFTVIMHDMDKIIMYPLLGKKLTKKIHNAHANHHNCKKLYHYLEKYLDCASARYTKPDKPMDAVETFAKLYPQHLHIAESIYSLTRYK